MLSKYNCLLFSTCVQIVAFGALTSFPAHAEFKWVPPAEPESIENVSPDVFVVDNEFPDLKSDVFSYENYSEQQSKSDVSNSIAIYIDPPIEVKGVYDESSHFVENPADVKLVVSPAENIVDGEKLESKMLPDLNPKLSKSVQIENGSIAEKNSLTPVLDIQDVKADSSPLLSVEKLAVNEPAVNEHAVDDSNIDVSNMLIIAPKISSTSVIDSDDDSKQSYEIIEGFAVEMPIALALSQIVPPEYAYSFGKNVDPGMRLSWEGGKEWDKVLSDALSPFGIKAVIHGKMVVLNAKNVPHVPKKSDNELVKDGAVDIIENLSELDAAVLPRTVNDEESQALLSNNSIILNKVDHGVKHNIKDKDTVKKRDSNKKIDDKVRSADVAIARVEVVEVDNLSNPSPLSSVPKNISDSEIVKPKTGFAERKQVEQTKSAEKSLPKPEIILSEQEKAEEEYARKLEENDPFVSSVDSVNSDEPTKSLSALNASEQKALDLLTPVPFEEKTIGLNEKNGNSDSIGNDNDYVQKQSSVDESEESLFFTSKPPSSDKEMKKRDDQKQFSGFRDVPSNKIRIWKARSNDDLQKVLTEWSKKENVPLIWEASGKYILDYDVFISGTYKNAVSIMFKKGLKKAPEYVINDSPYSIQVR